MVDRSRGIGKPISLEGGVDVPDRSGFRFRGSIVDCDPVGVMPSHAGVRDNGNRTEGLQAPFAMDGVGYVDRGSLVHLQFSFHECHSRKNGRIASDFFPDRLALATDLEKFVNLDLIG